MNYNVIVVVLNYSNLNPRVSYSKCSVNGASAYTKTDTTSTKQKKKQNSTST